MPDFFSFIGYIAGVFGLVATLAASVVVVRASVTKATIDTQKSLIEALTDRVDQLEKSDQENQLTIKKLEGQVDTFKNIPLDQIVKTQTQILTTQKEIVELLKNKGGHVNETQK